MNPDTLRPLIHRHLEGAATPEEASALALALLEDREAARLFADLTRLDSALGSHFQPEAASRRLADTLRFETAPKRRVSRPWLAAAAALVITGVCVAVWRPWKDGAATVAATTGTSPAKILATTAPPPPLMRRPGSLSVAAAEVKRLAERYWLPDKLEFSATPLQEAVAALQSRAGSVNHRKREVIANFAVDVPEEVAAAPVTAAHAELPLGTWLDVLAAQVGCTVRYTETGVAFEAVEEPDRLETRDFPLPADDGQTLAARAMQDAGLDWPQSTRWDVRDDHTLRVRHTRRQLRRLEGVLAASVSQATQPTVAIRAKDVAMPASAQTYTIDLNLAPEVVEFEGFVNYGTPVATDQTVVLTESRMEQPAVATWQEMNLSQSSSETTRHFARTDMQGAADVSVAGLPGATAVAKPSPQPNASRVLTADEAVAMLTAAVPGTNEAEWRVRLRANAADDPTADPWSGAFGGEVKLSDTAQFACSSPVIAAATVRYSFSIADTMPKLRVTARFEGEMVKLSGCYDATVQRGVPTDFEAWVGDGQSLLLQTEDSPAAPALVWTGTVNGRTDAANRLHYWNFQPQNSAVPMLSELPHVGRLFRNETSPPPAQAAVKGLLLSATVKWPTAGAK